MEPEEKIRKMVQAAAQQGAMSIQELDEALDVLDDWMEGRELDPECRPFDERNEDEPQYEFGDQMPLNF